MKTIVIVLLTQLLLAVAARANPFEYKWQELAPGVWAGIRQDPFELPQEGNAVFVVTDEGVVLFDAGGSPSMGESIVKQVRAVTTKPITHVVISHWHGDHMRGLQSIRAAFPAAAIFAHPHTREFIVATQDRWLKRRVTMVGNIRKSVDAASAKEQDLSGRPLIPAERAWLLNGTKILDELDRENQRTTYVIPTSTFDAHLTLHLGAKEIHFLHLGDAHTAGDVVMWLPQEKIVATGDIVTAPVPLMPSAYTNGYVAVLNKLKALNFTILVPGHGAVEHDAQYVDLLIDTITSVSLQMKALVAKGVAKDEAVRAIDYATIEKRFTNGDAFLMHRFEDYVTTPLANAAWVAETGAEVSEPF